MGGGTSGASVNTAISCPVTSALAAGAPPGFVLCALVEASPITSPTSKTSPRRNTLPPPRLLQARVLFCISSSFERWVQWTEPCFLPYKHPLGECNVHANGRV